jgi:hypothetical protein
MPNDNPNTGGTGATDASNKSAPDAETLQVLQTFKEALKKPVIVDILNLLFEHKEDADFLRQVDSHLQEIMPTEQIAVRSSSEGGSHSASGIVEDTRLRLEEIIREIGDSKILRKFFDTIVVHQHNMGFLVRFFDYISQLSALKKDRMEAKQHFIDAILTVGLNPQNSSIIKMDTSPFAIELTSEQAISIIPIQLEGLEKAIDALIRNHFAESYASKRTSDFQHRILFSHEGGFNEFEVESHQVVWLSRSDNTLVAMFMSHADDGEWILSFRDCFIVKKEPETQPAEPVTSAELLTPAESVVPAEPVVPTDPLLHEIGFGQREDTGIRKSEAPTTPAAVVHAIPDSVTDEPSMEIELELVRPGGEFVRLDISDKSEPPVEPVTADEPSKEIILERDDGSTAKLPNTVRPDPELPAEPVKLDAEAEYTVEVERLGSSTPTKSSVPVASALAVPVTFDGGPDEDHYGEMKMVVRKPVESEPDYGEITIERPIQDKK